MHDTQLITDTPIGTGGSQVLAWRVLGALGAFRMAISLLFLVLFLAVRDPHLVGWHLPVVFVATCVGYFLSGLVSLYAVRLRMPDVNLHAYMTLTIDIVAVTTLMHTSGGVQSGLASLLVLSIGAGALTMSRRAAALFAAIAALVLLVQQTVAQFGGLTTAGDYTPTGLLGAILFGIALAAQPLARRLRESEALAQQRSIDLANLAQLNEYIIQHLREAIVVVDSDDRIRLMNESAANHLGIRGNATGSSLRAASPKLWALTRTWRENAGRLPSAGETFVGADGVTVLTPQYAPIGDTGEGEPAALLVFLENSSELAERVQQTRLAALGRLSASIAHEIRNPVGAISHAGQLLAEAPDLKPPERRLTEIIHTHTGRVNAIIENVLQLSRRETTHPEQVALGEWLDGFVREFATTLRVPTETLHVADTPVELTVRFDPSQLGQVLWNLCENALRYAATDETTVAMLCYGRLHSNGRPYLEVLDRGPGIAEDDTVRIFEPFFTGASDGTGLGLYIARELCQCNGAALVYERRDGGGSTFRLIFADPNRWSV